MTMCVFRRQTDVFRFSGSPSKHFAFRRHLLKSTSETFLRFFALSHLQFVAVDIRLELKTKVHVSDEQNKSTNRTHTRAEVSVDNTVFQMFLFILESFRNVRGNTTETPPKHVLSANGSFYSTGLRWIFFFSYTYIYITYWTRRRIGRFFLIFSIYN